MALLVDGDLNGTGDLQALDSGILDVVNTEGIDASAKLKLAEREVSVEIARFLERESGLELENVVIDEGLRLWHATQTLAAVYRDAYFSQLNDRYGKRWEHWQKQASEHRAGYLSSGVPYVMRPLRRPSEVVAEAREGATPPASYWICATFVSDEGVESAPSELQVVTAEAPHLLTVSIGNAGAGATGWNVYLSDVDSRTQLQTPTPLDLNQTWVLAETAVIQPGREPGSGQTATDLLKRSGILRRG